jgi:uncharacterized membrane protein (UPF0127 family)
VKCVYTHQRVIGRLRQNKKRHVLVVAGDREKKEKGLKFKKNSKIKIERKY